VVWFFFSVKEVNEVMEAPKMERFLRAGWRNMHSREEMGQVSQVVRLRSPRRYEVVSASGTWRRKGEERQT
jgi:hypothetical protein